MARATALVHRTRRHDGHLVGRLQRAAGGRPAAAAAGLRAQSLLDRRPLRRRRALSGRLRAGCGHALVGVDDARLQRTPAGSRHRRRGVADDVARPAAGDPALHRGVARPSAPRRLLEARLGLRALREHRMPGLHGGWLERRLHERDSALPRRLPRPAQGPDRTVVAQLSRARRARPGDRVPAGSAALVRPLAQGTRDGDHGRAPVARLDAGAGSPCPVSPAAAGSLGRRACVAFADHRHPLAPAGRARPRCRGRGGRRAELSRARTARARRRHVVSLRRSPPTSRPTSATRTRARCASHPSRSRSGWSCWGSRSPCSS